MAIGKKAGKKSQQANDFLEPKQPTITSATNVGTGRAFNNGAVDVAFTLPGDSPAATGYTVTSNPGSFTATGASSPLQVTGLLSNTGYTFTVIATNASGNSIASAASSTVTVTTVPATPSAPTASSPNADQDQISWSAPANGGSAITNYHWESNDGKSGDTGTATSAALGQEPGTTQAYRVYATNANGNSDYSSYSNNITTTFSFVPFGVFGFSPFSVFGFSPFNVFGFSPFNVFGFSPFRVFGFSPSYFCIDGETPVLTKNGYVLAKNISNDDILLTKTFEELPITDHDGLRVWSSNDNKEYKTIESKITDIKKIQVPSTVIINKDNLKRFSTQEDILIVRDDKLMFVISSELKVKDKIVKDQDGTSDLYYIVDSIEILNENREVYDFMREPFGLIVADSLLVYNAYPTSSDSKL